MRSGWNLFMPAAVSTDFLCPAYFLNVYNFHHFGICLFGLGGSFCSTVSILFRNFFNPFIHAAIWRFCYGKIGNDMFGMLCYRLCIVKYLVRTCSFSILLYLYNCIFYSVYVCVHKHITIQLLCLRTKNTSNCILCAKI